MNKKDSIYLVQTDTTVGFASLRPEFLAFAKGRNPNQKILQVVDSFATLKNLVRVPKTHCHFVRNSTKTTFIYHNKNAFRVLNKSSNHFDFVKKFGHIYSTSANKTGEKFDLEFAINSCDIIVGNDFCELLPSKIYRLYRQKKINIRR